MTTHFERVAVPALMARAHGKTGSIQAAPTVQPTPTPKPESTATVPELLKRAKEQVAEIQEKLSPTPYGRFRNPDGTETVRRLQRPEEAEFAPIRPYFEKAKQADSRPGRSRGDEMIERRRRETELQRELSQARSRLLGAPVADKPRWEAEIARLLSEIETLITPRDQERDRQRSVVGEPGSDAGVLGDQQSAVAVLRTKAQLLQRIVDDHAGTSWTERTRANAELIQLERLLGQME